MSRRLVFWALVLTLSGLSPGWLQADQGKRRAPDPPRPAPQVVVRGEVFIGGYFYDPVYGTYPWWPRNVYPHWYFPRYDNRAYVRMSVTPDEAAVYVDGFYAGVVDDFDGVFDGLPLSPGGHSITFYLAGYRTVQHNIHVPAASTFKLRDVLEKLPPGIASAAPALAPLVPAPPRGSYRLPSSQPPLSVPLGITAQPVLSVGTLDLTVQPATAVVLIDGRRWVSSEGAHFVVQLPAGTHRIEVTEIGYQRFITDVVVRDGEMSELTVSLVAATR
jgi:hypothetical protein